MEEVLEVGELSSVDRAGGDPHVWPERLAAVHALAVPLADAIIGADPSDPRRHADRGSEPGARRATVCGTASGSLAFVFSLARPRKTGAERRFAIAEYDAGASNTEEARAVVDGAMPVAHEPPGQARLPLRRRVVAIHDEPLVLVLAPEAPSVAIARAAVAQVAARCGASVADVALCVSEAVSNAVVHAFRHREDGSGTIRVLALRGEDGVLCVTVEDDGRGILEPRSDSPGLGLGLALIGAVALSLEITGTDAGSRVRIRFAVRG